MRRSLQDNGTSARGETDAECLSYTTFLRAQDTISGLVHETPLLSFATLGRRVGRPVFLKCENLQKTGSFKVRGALVSLAGLTPACLAKGVVTISAGNHAQAVAWACAVRGVEATVVMPVGASRAKIRATEGYGAKVVLHGTAAQAFVEARRLADANGSTFLHPFDAPAVIAGQGTVALEILSQLLRIDSTETRSLTGGDLDLSIVVPVGGGGQISGIAGAIGSLQREDPPSTVTSLARRTKVYGVEPRGAPGMHRSLEEGRAMTLDMVETVADGLAAPMAGELNYRHVARYAEDVFLVEDEQILEAMVWTLLRTKLLTEPAGATGVAAVMQELLPAGDGPVVIVLTGGNVDTDIIQRAFAELG